MQTHFSSRTTRGILLAGLLFGCAGHLLAQTTGARGGTTQARRPATTTNANRGTTAPGGGGGGGSASGGNRQYINSTMIGDAMITSDLETRRLIVVTDEETNESIRTIVESLDKPKPQVLINVVFVQVTHDKDLDLGTEATWTGKLAVKTEPNAVASSRFGLADALADPTKFGAFYRILGEDVSATIHALSSLGKTEILSRPSILTRNSQQATIMVGQSVPIITNSRVVDQTNATINTVQYQDVGIILRVTPFINADGLVEMIVSPEISSLSATTVPISNTVSSPVIDKRSADTVVVTPSDRTVVIGGLISTEVKDLDSKVPLLGDIPLLGYAFKRKQKSTTKTELLIFLTPRVIQNPGDLSQASDGERAKMNLAPKAFPAQELERYIGKP